MGAGTRSSDIYSAHCGSTCHGLESASPQAKRAAKRNLKVRGVHFLRDTSTWIEHWGRIKKSSAYPNPFWLFFESWSPHLLNGDNGIDSAGLTNKKKKVISFKESYLQTQENRFSNVALGRDLRSF